MLIPFTLLALLEDPVKSLWGWPTARVGFFWGMLTMFVSLLLLIEQPETWVCLAITLAVSALAIVALFRTREPASSTSS
jgi:hypothetical protein